MPTALSRSKQNRTTAVISGVILLSLSSFFVIAKLSLYYMYNILCKKGC